MWIDVFVLNFQIKICCRYFGIFWLGDSFGLLFEKLGDFCFKSSGHPGPSLPHLLVEKHFTDRHFDVCLTQRKSYLGQML
jgi:hypothetical protein